MAMVIDNPQRFDQSRIPPGQITPSKGKYGTTNLESRLHEYSYFCSSFSLDYTHLVLKPAPHSARDLPPGAIIGPQRPQMLQSMQHGDIRKRNAQFHILPETNLLDIDVLIQTSANGNEIRKHQQRERLKNEQATHDPWRRKKYYQAQAEGSKLLQRRLQFVSGRLQHTKSPQSSKLCITYTISQDMTKDEETYMKSRLCAIQDRPLMLAARSTVL